MSQYLIQGETLTAIADAIRAKKETTAIFSPAQMAVEIESIVVGDDLPDAEGVLFGTEAEEHGILSHGTMTLNANTGGHFGWKFTVNTDFAITGLRTYQPAGNTSKVQLWDSSGNRIALLSITSSKDGWTEMSLPTPINVKAGETYVVSKAFQGTYYTSYSGVTFNGKVTYKERTYAYGGKADTFPNSTTTNSNLYGFDIIIGAPITESVVQEYKIQTETLNTIADEVTRITGGTGTLTPEQIITALQGIT